jgi:hypothetical protein
VFSNLKKMGRLSGSKASVGAIGEESGEFIIYLILTYCLDRAAFPCCQLAMLKRVDGGTLLPCSSGIESAGDRGF